MFNQRLAIEGQTLTHELTQPSRGLILDTAAELRKAGGIPDAEGLGRWALSIPFEDWLRLREKYPDLASTDAKVKSRAYARLIASPESAPFRVRDRV